MDTFDSGLTAIRRAGMVLMAAALVCGSSTPASAYVHQKWNCSPVENDIGSSFAR